MGRLKKFISRLLTGVLLLSSIPFNSYAEINGGGNGNDSRPSTYEIVGSFHTYHVNQGFRMTVVNAEGVAVTNSVDFVMYFPEELDALIDASHSLAVTEWTDYAVQPYKGNTGSMKGKPKRYITYLGGCKTDPLYVKSLDCVIFPDGLTQQQITANKSIVKGLQTVKRLGSYTRDTSNPSNCVAIEAKMYTYSLLHDMLTEDGKRHGYVNPIDGTNGTHESIDAATGEKKVLPKKFQNPLTTYDVGGGVSGFYANGDELRAQLMTQIEVKGANGASEKQTIVQRILELNGYDVSGRGERKSKDWIPVFEYLDPKLNQQYLEEKSKGTIAPMSKVFKDNNLRLLIESVSWRIPGIVDPFDPRPEFRGGGGWELMQTSYCTDNIVYGTATNVYKYVTEQWYHDRKAKGWFPDMPAIEDYENWLQWFCYQTGHGFAWQPAFNNDEYRLAEDAPDLGLYYYDGETQGSLYNLLKYWNSLGYAVMVTTLDGTKSGTPTWDKENYPEDNYKPGPSPENIIPGKPKGPEYPPKYPSEGEPYKTPEFKDHQFNIVKFYAEKQPDGSYVYTENHTRNNTIHTININDEPSYKVDGWFTSPTFRQPTNKTDSYDDFKNTLSKGEQEGNKSGDIVIKPESKDTTLYIRLVNTPMLTIVKYFPDGSNKIEEIPWQPSYDTNEPGYEYEEDKQDPNKPDPIPDNFESTTGKPGSNPIIPVDPTSRVVYIKYKQPEADSKITLHQNELAHTFTLEDIQSLVTLTHSFGSLYKSGSGQHGSGSDVWYCDWETIMDDKNYSYAISNKENYGATTFVGSQGAFESQEIGKNNDSGTIGIDGGQSEGLTPNLKFSIYRDKAKDNVTLYPNKNNAVKSELSDIFITAEGYTPQTTRVLDKGQIEWYSTFKINYTYDVEDNRVTSKSDHTCHGSGVTQDGSPHPALGTINDPFSQANNVLTKAFLGQPGTGDKITTLNEAAFEMLGMTFQHNLKFTPKSGDSGKFANDGKFFEFYPYTEMEYQTVTDLNNKLAYIVSTNLSKVKNNTTMEVGVFKRSNGYGINLSSEQWSTHARTIQGLAENGIPQNYLNRALIPGGAVVKLNTSNSGSINEGTAETWVGFRSYEMSVPDDLKVTLSATDGVKTTSEAKTAGSTFFNDMKENLRNYHVEKWIKEGITTNENDLDRSTKVSGIANVDGGPATSFGGNTLSTDKKYYLKSNVSDATSSKFDTIKEEFEQHVYKVYSDVYGKVTVTKDGSEIISANIKSSKDISSLLSNPDVKRIDDRVKFVTNFVESLDFEGGRDREAIPWYYEAHDGLEVVETMGAAQVGFGGDAPIRSEVVDTKLTGKLENRDDTLNFDSSKLDEKTRTVQYRMSASPTTKPGVAGYIGTFNGLDITVPSMNRVMRTRLHYMGNNTVMDLN